MGRELASPVSCYSGLEYAGRPRSFEWQGKRLVVAAVEAEWRAPDSKRFRVLTTGERRFDLVYYVLNDRWSIQPA
jgi:hypothetical protein